MNGNNNIIDSVQGMAVLKKNSSRLRESIVSRAEALLYCGKRAPGQPPETDKGVSPLVDLLFTLACVLSGERGDIMSCGESSGIGYNTACRE